MHEISLNMPAPSSPEGVRGATTFEAWWISDEAPSAYGINSLRKANYEAIHNNLKNWLQAAWNASRAAPPVAKPEPLPNPYSWEFTEERLKEISENPRGAMIGKQEAKRLVEAMLEKLRSPNNGFEPLPNTPQGERAKIEALKALVQAGYSVAATTLTTDQETVDEAWEWLNVVDKFYEQYPEEKIG
jgi:hypothetical protein